MRGLLYLLLTLVGLLPSASQASAVHDAAKKGDVAAIIAALDGGADVNEIDDAGKAPALYYTALAGHLDAAKLLIARGANVHLASKWGGEPVLRAAWQGHNDVLSFLLANGANPKSEFETDTALHKAADRGCLDCVRTLVEAGADVNAINSKREPPIHFAKKRGHSAVADYLLKNGYEIPIPPAISAKLNSADSLKGKALYLKQCRNCHDATQKMFDLAGPPLWGIVGRPKASIATFKYSEPIRESGGDWTYDELNAFISDPRRILPGTEMQAEGYQNEEDRADLIVYLRTLSESPLPLPTR
jgi:cytochrome c